MPWHMSRRSSCHLLGIIRQEHLSTVSLQKKPTFCQDTLVDSKSLYENKCQNTTFSSKSI